MDMVLPFRNPLIQLHASGSHISSIWDIASFHLFLLFSFPFPSSSSASSSSSSGPPFLMFNLCTFSFIFSFFNVFVVALQHHHLAVSLVFFFIQSIISFSFLHPFAFRFLSAHIFCESNNVSQNLSFFICSIFLSFFVFVFGFSKPTSVLSLLSSNVKSQHIGPSSLIHRLRISFSYHIIIICSAIPNHFPFDFRFLFLFMLYLLFSRKARLFFTIPNASCILHSHLIMHTHDPIIIIHPLTHIRFCFYDQFHEPSLAHFYHFVSFSIHSFM
ncbi:hypothetical protein CPC08DRAFT_171426 [Agrocybe pediades]|nr:hypothetical protein CPC08DRAFT_171426 [Agrocybe pediades]